MTWVVVGSSGQLGCALRKVLDQRKITHIDLESKDLDIRSPEKCLSLITSIRPSVIINAAAWTDVDSAESDPFGAFAVNKEGALNLALAAKSTNSIFVHISTDYIFSGKQAQPWSETDIYTPISVYGRSKAEGEAAVLSVYPDKSYIFRTAWLYSRWRNNFAKTILRKAITSSGEVRVVDDQVGQPTSAVDLAHQIVNSLKVNLPFGIYHATNRGECSWFDFAIQVFRLSNEPISRIIPIKSTDFFRAAARPSYSVLGHKNWENCGDGGVKIPPMRDWQEALKEEFPEILANVLEESN